jgi:spore coat protein U-like protein
MRAWALALLMLIFVPSIARAAAIGTCTVISNDIAFGSFSGTQITLSGSIMITCSNGNGSNTLPVSLNYGNSSSNFPSSTANRVMQMGANTLPYQIYSNASRTTIWGNGTGGTAALSVPINYVPPNNSPVMTTVVPYATLFAGALPPVGNYTDAVTVSLQNTSTVIHMSANAVPACTVTANNLAFGSYSRTQLDGTATLTATCSSGSAYNIGLNQGVASGATVSNRSMAGPGGQLLKYSLFRDSSRTINWGNTVGTDTAAATGTGSAQNFTIYGRVPASQNVAPGAYQDTITATLTF